MEKIHWQNKIIGEVVERDSLKVFVKSVNPEKHKLRIFDAYGIQEEVFEKLKVDTIWIKEPTRTLSTSYENWKSTGVVRDFGDGKQRFLSVKHMVNL